MSIIALYPTGLTGQSEDYPEEGRGQFILDYPTRSSSVPLECTADLYFTVMFSHFTCGSTICRREWCREYPWILQIVTGQRLLNLLSGWKKSLPSSIFLTNGICMLESTKKLTGNRTWKTTCAGTVWSGETKPML